MTREAAYTLVKNMHGWSTLWGVEDVKTRDAMIADNQVALAGVLIAILDVLIDIRLAVDRERNA